MAKKTISQPDRPKPVRTISDVMVHYLFARRKTEPILISFVNAVLTDAGFSPIVKAKVGNPFNVKTFPTEKETVLDISAEDENSRKIHVEVQFLEEEAFVERCVYYNSKAYSSQLVKKDDYAQLRPVVSIILTEFTLFPDLDRLRTSFYLTAKEVPGYLLTEHLQLHFIQMPKDFRTPALKGVNGALARWLKFFGFPGKVDEKELKSLGKKDKGLAMAIKEYEKFQDDPKLRDLVERREKFLRDVNSSRMTAIRRARVEGEAEGEARGEARGKAVGIAESKAEIAISLLKEGLSVDFIIKTTGLSEQEVKKLATDR